jgi:hypothetical protein
MQTWKYCDTNNSHTANNFIYFMDGPYEMQNVQNQKEEIKKWPQ